MMMNRSMNGTRNHPVPRPYPQMSHGTLPTEKAKIERKKLLSYLSEISFALNDLTLYLDTHENEEEALQYFFELNQKRKEALKDYSRWYGPLVLDRAVPSDYWHWASQPMPWEGGAC